MRPGEIRLNQAVTQSHQEICHGTLCENIGIQISLVQAFTLSSTFNFQLFEENKHTHELVYKTFIGHINLQVCLLAHTINTVWTRQHELEKQQEPNCFQQNGEAVGSIVLKTSRKEEGSSINPRLP